MRISTFVVCIIISFCLMFLCLMPNSHWIHVIGPSLSIMYLYALDSYWETQVIWPILGGYIAVIVYFATYTESLVLISYISTSCISVIDSVLKYISASRDCTTTFKDTCFRNFLLDVSVLNVTILAILSYFAISWWIGLCSNIAFLIYFVMVNKRLRESIIGNTITSNDLQNNQEQEQLFGINEDGI